MFAKRSCKFLPKLYRFNGHIAFFDEGKKCVCMCVCVSVCACLCFEGERDLFT